jgi:GR25 family glycosyltransferase involved in LPS biosynthesis
VLEDDIVLVEGFTDKLRTNLQAADEEQAQEQGEADGGAYDVLFLGAIGKHRELFYCETAA